MAANLIQFHLHPQESAVSEFLPLLRPHLPESNPLYNRLQARNNVPSRHCIFAATFAPSDTPPEIYTVMFADRSRHLESQIWVFNPLTRIASLSDVQKETLRDHLEASIYFFKTTQIPEAPGWPFSPILKYACLHEHIAAALVSVGEAKEAVPRLTRWNMWIVSTSGVAAGSAGKRALPEGYTVARVPEDQLDIVIATSSIPRQPSTLLLLPNVGLLDEQGVLVAWGYIGIDGSFATLYVLPKHRGKGLASRVAVELLGSLNRGDFKDLGYDGDSGFVHSDVYAGNMESEGVMKSLGGKVCWESSYLWIDSDKF
ncbi:hypothetical protein BT63DRAFT_428203 [Microthyrium microscopicum]|uniref:GCN5-related N-acetyltransferase Rv2170-like domain-containing protein n=1 Tax=Microthyrium microscopicum TaxID=703497 RepID=A0A6A6U4R8_9PEZI|nr:hypothetical protein BT63DRAFT_428203 [Microthyrium microscopicum]